MINLELKRLRYARYNKSAKRKTTSARYRATEKGKATDKKHDLKQRHTPRRKAYLKKYDQLPHRKASRATYNERTKEEKYIYSLKRFYGLSAEEYYALLEKQKGLCALCGVKPTGKLVVDHCHKTGRIRGILCRKCNLGLGLLGDTAEFLAKAVAYLE